METSASNRNFEKKICKTYCLTTVFILSSLIQWFLLVNFESCEFLLNYWLLYGAVATFTLIIIFTFITNFIVKKVPAALEWILAVLIIEILTISLGHTVYFVANYLLYGSLAVILICMGLIIAIGKKVNLDLLPIFVLTVFSCNMLFIIVVMALMIIANFFVEYYNWAVIVATVIAYPILIINTLYVSLLIKNDRYEIKSLTGCLRPALYICALFAAFTWFTLAFVLVLDGGGIMYFT